MTTPSSQKHRPWQNAGTWWATPLARLAMLLGLVIHALGFLLFQVTQNNAPPAHPPSTTLRYLSQDDNTTRALAEQSLFFDALPLFFPTPLSGRSDFPVPPPRLQPLFPQHPPRLTLSNETLPSNSQRPQPLPPPRLLPMMTPDDWRLLTLPPESESQLTKVLPDSLQLTLSVHNANGQIVRQKFIQVDSETALTPLWKPLQARLLQSDAGFHGPALWTSQSDSSELNEAAHQWLAPENILSGLPAGIYEVSIGL